MGARSDDSACADRWVCDSFDTGDRRFVLIELATLLCHVRMQASRAELRLLDPFTDRVNSGGHQKAPAASASVVVEIGIAENGAAFTSNEERRRKKLGTDTYHDEVGPKEKADLAVWKAQSSKGRC